jgi:hypothetical protein
MMDALLDGWAEIDALIAGEPADGLDLVIGCLGDLWIIWWAGARMTAATFNLVGAELQGALDRLGEATGEAISRGYNVEAMRAFLDYWSDATNGPRITLEIGA